LGKDNLFNTLGIDLGPGNQRFDHFSAKILSIEVTE
jgi:hypothetical protein